MPKPKKPQTKAVMIEVQTTLSNRDLKALAKVALQQHPGVDDTNLRVEQVTVMTAQAPKL